MKTLNKKVAVKPLGKERVAKFINKSGFVTSSQSIELIPLEVVFDSLTFKKGDVIYVDGNAASNQEWGKKVYEIEGVQFSLCPEDQPYLQK